MPREYTDAEISEPEIISVITNETTDILTKFKLVFSFVMFWGRGKSTVKFWVCMNP